MRPAVLAAAALLAASQALAAERPSLAQARRWACFYGGNISDEAWGSLDLVVADPDGFRVPPATGPVRLAYVSAGEADERRAFWRSVQGRPFIVEPNPDWPGAHRVDLRAPEWRKLLTESVVPGALAKGYQGVMFDTLDVAEHLESSAPARFGGSVRAAGDLILEVRSRHPQALILINNALSLLPRIGGAIDGVVVEDLYTRCMPGDDPCGPSPPEARAKEAVLRRFARETGKPVFVLLYARLRERDSRWVRDAVARSRREGFLPYLATPTLERLGVVNPGNSGWNLPE